MFRILLLVLLVASASFGQGEGCLIEVVAGGGKSFSGDGGQAALAELDHPGDAVARPDGSIYVADTGNGRVRVISPEGVISTILESPEPARIAVSPEGDLFVFDREQRRIIRRMSNGFVRTVLADRGLGADVGLDAGPGPTLYLADADNGRMLKLDRTGRVTTLSAEIGEPSDVALGPDGSLYVADVENGKVKRVWPDGAVNDFAEIPGRARDLSFVSFLLGIPTLRPIYGASVTPRARLAVNADGEVAVTSDALPILGIPLDLDSYADFLAGIVDPGRALVVLRFGSDGRQSGVFGPVPGQGASIDWMPDGRILLGSRTLDQLFALAADRSYEVVAGAGAAGPSGDGGLATEARLRAPQSVAALSTGEIFIADEARVRVVGPDGAIRPADVTLPEAYLASDAMDNLFVSGGDELLRRTPGGAVETVALAADCADCLGSAFLFTPGPYAFGRIAATADDIWVQGRSTSSRLVRVTRNGELSPVQLPLEPFRFSLFDSYAGNLGSDSQGGVTLATAGLIYALQPDSEEWQEIPGSAGFARGDVQHVLRTEQDDVYFTREDRVIRLTPEGALNTVARLQAPSALALAANGDLLIADSAAGTVSKLRSPTECDRTVRPQIYVGGVSNSAGRGGLYPQIGVAGQIILAARVTARAPFAPGIIASVFGVRLASGEAAAYDRHGSFVPTELAGVSATAGGKPAGVAFASESQLNLVLPFDLPEEGDVDLVVTVDGVPSEPYTLAMGPASPGVFAVVNADGSVNSQARPAKAGDEVSLLVSGLGRPEVEVDALAISDDAIPWPTENLTVELQPADFEAESVTATTLWARSRPGEIASLVEVRFRIPEGVYLSTNGTDAALVRGDVVTLFDLYVE